MSIYKMPVGAILELSQADINICKTAIQSYDPGMADIKQAIKSDGDYLLELHLEDGAVWKLQEHPIGLIPSLTKLGTSHEGKPLTANLASAYRPDPSTLTTDRQASIVPEVDCGEGYRQLEFDESIKKGDEYYAGPRGGWKKATDIGDHYNPVHGNHSRSQFALMRRALPEPHKAPKI